LLHIETQSDRSHADVHAETDPRSERPVVAHPDCPAAMPPGWDAYVHAHPPIERELPQPPRVALPHLALLVDHALPKHQPAPLPSTVELDPATGRAVFTTEARARFAQYKARLVVEDRRRSMLKAASVTDEASDPLSRKDARFRAVQRRLEGTLKRIKEDTAERDAEIAGRKEVGLHRRPAPSACTVGLHRRPAPSTHPLKSPHAVDPLSRSVMGR
jgi:hypothetical protein